MSKPPAMNEILFGQLYEAMTTITSFSAADPYPKVPRITADVKYWRSTTHVFSHFFHPIPNSPTNSIGMRWVNGVLNADPTDAEDWEVRYDAGLDTRFALLRGTIKGTDGACLPASEHGYRPFVFYDGTTMVNIPFVEAKDAQKDLPIINGLQHYACTKENMYNPAIVECSLHHADIVEVLVYYQLKHGDKKPGFEENALPPFSFVSYGRPRGTRFRCLYDPEVDRVHILWRQVCAKEYLAVFGADEVPPPDCPEDEDPLRHAYPLELQDPFALVHIARKPAYTTPELCNMAPTPYDVLEYFDEPSFYHPEKRSGSNYVFFGKYATALRIFVRRVLVPRDFVYFMAPKLNLLVNGRLRRDWAVTLDHTAAQPVECIEILGQKIAKLSYFTSWIADCLRHYELNPHIALVMKSYLCFAQLSDREGFVRKTLSSYRDGDYTTLPLHPTTGYAPVPFYDRQFAYTRQFIPKREKLPLFQQSMKPTLLHMAQHMSRYMAEGSLFSRVCYPTEFTVFPWSNAMTLGVVVEVTRVQNNIDLLTFPHEYHHRHHHTIARLFPTTKPKANPINTRCCEPLHPKQERVCVHEGTLVKNYNDNPQYLHLVKELWATTAAAAIAEKAALLASSSSSLSSPEQKQQPPPPQKKPTTKQKKQPQHHHQSQKNRLKATITPCHYPELHHIPPQLLEPPNITTRPENNVILKLLTTTTNIHYNPLKIGSTSPAALPAGHPATPHARLTFTQDDAKEELPLIHTHTGIATITVSFGSHRIQVLSTAPSEGGTDAIKVGDVVLLTIFHTRYQAKPVIRCVQKVEKLFYYSKHQRLQTRDNNIKRGYQLLHRLDAISQKKYKNFHNNHGPAEYCVTYSNEGLWRADALQYEQPKISFVNDILHPNYPPMNSIHFHRIMLRFLKKARDAYLEEFDQHRAIFGQRAEPHRGEPRHYEYDQTRPFPPLERDAIRNWRNIDLDFEDAITSSPYDLIPLSFDHFSDVINQLKTGKGLEKYPGPGRHPLVGLDGPHPEDYLQRKKYEETEVRCRSFHVCIVESTADIPQSYLCETKARYDVFGEKGGAIPSLKINPKFPLQNQHHKLSGPLPCHVLHKDAEKTITATLAIEDPEDPPKCTSLLVLPHEMEYLYPQYGPSINPTSSRALTTGYIQHKLKKHQQAQAEFYNHLPTRYVSQDREERKRQDEEEAAKKKKVEEEQRDSYFYNTPPSRLLITHRYDNTKSIDAAPPGAVVMAIVQVTVSEHEKEKDKEKGKNKKTTTKKSTTATAAATTTTSQKQEEEEEKSVPKDVYIVTTTPITSILLDPKHNQELITDHDNLSKQVMAGFFYTGRLGLPKHLDYNPWYMTICDCGFDVGVYEKLMARRQKEERVEEEKLKKKQQKMQKILAKRLSLRSRADKVSQQMKLLQENDVLLLEKKEQLKKKEDAMHLLQVGSTTTEQKATQLEAKLTAVEQRLERCAALQRMNPAQYQEMLAQKNKEFNRDKNVLQQTEKSLRHTKALLQQQNFTKEYNKKTSRIENLTKQIGDIRRKMDEMGEKFNANINRIRQEQQNMKQQQAQHKKDENKKNKKNKKNHQQNKKKKKKKCYITPFQLIYQYQDVINRVCTLPPEFSQWNQEKFALIDHVLNFSARQTAIETFAELTASHTTHVHTTLANINTFQNFIVQTHQSAFAPLCAWFQHYHTVFQKGIYAMIVLCVKKIDTMRALGVKETNPKLLKHLEHYYALASLGMCDDQEE